MITELEETRKELDLQNTQGEDLMSQLEVIGDHIGIAVSQWRMIQLSFINLINCYNNFPLLMSEEYEKFP